MSHRKEDLALSPAGSLGLGFLSHCGRATLGNSGIPPSAQQNPTNLETALYTLNCRSLSVVLINLGALGSGRGGILSPLCSHRGGERQAVLVI